MVEKVGKEERFVGILSSSSLVLSQNMSIYVGWLHVGASWQLSVLRIWHSERTVYFDLKLSPYIACKIGEGEREMTSNYFPIFYCLVYQLYSQVSVCYASHTHTKHTFFCPMLRWPPPPCDYYTLI